MQEELLLGTKTIQYAFQQSRHVKHIRLVVRIDGSIVVTAPKAFQKSFIERFLIEKGDWILSKLAYFKRFTPGHWVYLNKQDYEKNRDAARAFVLERLKQFNAFYQLKFNRVSIRNQKTRWGSCSCQKNLSFNYKLIYLPAHLADYVIVHELCHLQELNHSPRFWQLVALALPEYAKYRRELREILVSW